MCSFFARPVKTSMIPTGWGAYMSVIVATAVTSTYQYPHVGKRKVKKSVFFIP